MKKVVKITIDCEDGTCRVFEGDDAQHIATGIVKLYTGYKQREMTIDLMNSLRKSEELS